MKNDFGAEVGSHPMKESEVVYEIDKGRKEGRKDGSGKIKQVKGSI
jgi:hypothetical protein